MLTRVALQPSRRVFLFISLGKSGKSFLRGWSALLGAVAGDVGELGRILSHLEPEVAVRALKGNHVAVVFVQLIAGVEGEGCNFIGILPPFSQLLSAPYGAQTAHAHLRATRETPVRPFLALLGSPCCGGSTSRVACVMWGQREGPGAFGVRRSSSGRPGAVGVAQGRCSSEAQNSFPCQRAPITMQMI